MKKILFLCLVFLIFSGCTAEKNCKPILNNIKFDVEISYGENNYSGQVTILDDIVTFTVNKPDNIDGLKFIYGKDNVVTEYKGLSKTINSSNLPKGDISQIIYKVLNNSKTKNIINKTENCDITGNIDGYKYLFTFSPTGLPIKLVLEELNLNIIFKNVTMV